MKKKLLTLALLGVVCTGVVAGCGKSDTAKTDENSSQTVSDVQTEAEVSASDAEASDKEYNAKLNVYAAASLADALNDAIAEYNKTQPGVEITPATGSSGDLMTQIEESDGVDVDVFFSAATKQMDQLVADGYVDEANVVKLLKNEIVLIGAKDSDTKVTGFDNITDAKNIALADDTVPVGQYAREAFDSLGISVDDFAEVNECVDVSAVKEAVKEGSNEIGIVYYSDYYSVKDDVELIEVCDQNLYNECVYPVAVVNNKNADDEQSDAAKDFVAFLQTDAAKQIFEDYMFTIY